jgi:dnaX_nterm: DNA polymerase III, subunit gamma and tau
MLSAAAFNAFLKTLEEPPAHAIFILATTEKHKIIPTILSRCQIYDFNRIRVEDGVEYLKYIASQEGIAADEESLNLIAQKADGGMRDALSMFDKAVSFCGKALDYRNVAQTLNVLDYDTYFGVTEMLLAGNYVDTLVTFDSVLSRGFSGQTFMAGLNRHMRDLLMAKRPETLRLIEMTGTLLERYRTQAGACDVEFLFGAISCLTELDGKIRQSSNQRLFVELGLMKIAGLGQKKNDSLTSSGEYPLPTLTPRTAGPASAAAPAAAGQPATATAQAAEVSATGNPATNAPAANASGNPAAPAAATAQPAGVSATGNPATNAPAASASGNPGAPAAATAQPAAQAAGAATAPPSAATSAAMPAASPAGRPAAGTSAGPTAQGTLPAQPAPGMKRRPLISGASLSELLASAGGDPDEELSDGETPDEPETVRIDPDCAEKLEHARGRILNLIKEKRPRFVPAFELMTFRDNTISVSVPTTELREEILRSKTGMLMRIAELAGIEGMIELEVTVNEEIRAARPIKLEDRVRYITEKNPLVAELRKALDLEVE